nr:MAG TPA: hypothetical protein [Caudoviricetes sp.]
MALALCYGKKVNPYWQPLERQSPYMTVLLPR